MVFGWGKKKQEEKPIEEITADKQICLSDVPKIVTDLQELRKSQTISEIKNLRNATAPLIDDLINIGKMLEKDNLNVDDIDKHLAIIVVRGKKQVINIIKKGVTRIPEISSIENALELDSTLNQILKKVGDVLGRQTRVIHIFAKKYAAQLKNNLEVMNKNHSEIHAILKIFDHTKSISDEILDYLTQIKTLRETRTANEKKIIETKENIVSLEKKILSIQTSIEEIKSSENYKKYLDLKKSLDEFGNQRTKIKNDIDAQFTKISRPLSRYEYASSLDKDQKNILTKLNTDPFGILLPKNKDSIILILENVRKAVSSESISVKDIDKTLSQITETEEVLDGFVKQVSEYFKKYEQLENDLNSLNPKNLFSLENDLEKNISFKKDAELKSKIIQNEVDEIISKIPRFVTKIEEKLRQFSNTKYILDSS
ncbi:exonuclease SbcC [Nitrosopumilus ureiphilus]|uniref:Exonuclease SbcC n=1 Tax=Nitrosopumilus ureiphilus TaxID=1470067 RepID=A0A7D5R2Z1_9ARCH|nr:exonuclease SbcC [Nitrosopumilus ureiphilus]QLH06560.1 exonuclease SbcC [Nitrosopumilus ureiphilus]